MSELEALSRLLGPPVGRVDGGRIGMGGLDADEAEGLARKGVPPAPLVSAKLFLGLKGVVIPVAGPRLALLER